MDLNFTYSKFKLVLQLKNMEYIFQYKDLPKEYGVDKGMTFYFVKYKRS